MRIKILKNQEGVTLFLSLLIMSTVVAVAIGVSVLIINQYEFSSNVDHAITAFYAAETGLEKKLEAVKDIRISAASLPLSAADPATDTVIKRLNTAAAGSILSGAASWQTAAADSQDYILGNLRQNEKVTIDIFPPDLSAATGGGVESIKINWRDNCQPQGLPAGLGWLKLSHVSLAKILGFAGFDATTNPYENIFPCGTANDCVPRISNEFSTINYYRLFITPLYCDIGYLKVTAYSGNDASGTEKEISNRVSLTSVGTYADSKIALSASAPWILPTQGIFDFVLFSESTIDKK